MPTISLYHMNLYVKLIGPDNLQEFNGISWSTSGLKAYVPSKEFLYLKKKRKEGKKKEFFNLKKRRREKKNFLI